MREVKVVRCPYCSDIWVTDKDVKGVDCLCFRCRNIYKPSKIYKMWQFVFNAIKSVKGK